LNLARPMQAYSESHHVYLHGFPNTTLGHGHWNQIGHQVAGQLLASKVCKMLEAETPDSVGRLHHASDATPAPIFVSRRRDLSIDRPPKRRDCTRTPAERRPSSATSVAAD